jgi:histidinol phosphatase-like PHP family hydrolase
MHHFEDDLVMPLILPDHHIHTKASRCCHELYSLLDVAKRLQDLNYSYICVSDHIHYDEDDRYFEMHIANATRLIKDGLSVPIFIGGECTIVDLKGRIPNLRNSKGKLGYILLGDHYIPETRINMDDLNLAKDILKCLFQKDKHKLKEIINNNISIYIRGIERYKPQILVHPFSTLLRADFTHIDLIEGFEKVCEMCQNSGTAIELNNVQILDCLENPKPNIIESPDIPQKPEFYRALMKVALSYDIKFSVGSDAHLLKNVGEISAVRKLIEKLDINKEKILYLCDPEAKANQFILK